MNNLIQKLNDKYLELDSIQTELDKLLGNVQEVEVIVDAEEGRHCSVMRCIDEEGIDILSRLLYRLEKVLEG